MQFITKTREQKRGVEVSYQTQKSHWLRDREIEIRAAATARKEGVTAEKAPQEVNPTEKTAMVVQRIAALLENPSEGLITAAMATSSSNSQIQGQEEGVIDNCLINNTWDMEVNQHWDSTGSNLALVLKQPNEDDCGA